MERSEAYVKLKPKNFENHYFFPSCWRKTIFFLSNAKEPSCEEARLYNFFQLDVHHTVWKLQKFTLITFWQKFRENNVFSNEDTKELISRNIFWWERISRFSTLCAASRYHLCIFFKKYVLSNVLTFTF